LELHLFESLETASAHLKLCKILSELQAIHRLVEWLSFEVRGVAGSLVDGFAIPDSLLRAPIGLQSGQYSEYSHYVGFD
jgi:acyl-CoA oxidase